MYLTILSIHFLSFILKKKKQSALHTQLFSDQCSRYGGFEQRIIHEGYRAILIQTIDEFSAEGSRQKNTRNRKGVVIFFLSLFPSVKIILTKSVVAYKD